MPRTFVAPAPVVVEDKIVLDEEGADVKKEAVDGKKKASKKKAKKDK